MYLITRDRTHSLLQVLHYDYWLPMNNASGVQQGLQYISSVNLKRL